HRVRLGERTPGDQRGGKIVWTDAFGEMPYRTVEAHIHRPARCEVSDDPPHVFFGGVGRERLNDAPERLDGIATLGPLNEGRHRRACRDQIASRWSGIVLEVGVVLGEKRNLPRPPRGVSGTREVDHSALTARAAGLASPGAAGAQDAADERDEAGAAGDPSLSFRLALPVLMTNNEALQGRPRQLPEARP